jgi:hypothetical protein
MRKVFFGGFASDERHVSVVTEELSTQLDEDVEGISFREAMRDPLRADKLAKGALAITHSAGMMPLHGAYPAEIMAVAPPLPTRSVLLIARAALSVVRLTAGSVSSVDRIKRVARYDWNAGAELARHPKTNLGEIGNIGRFDAFQAGREAVDSEIGVTIGLMKSDLYFHPDPDKLAAARDKGVTVVEGIDGGHEEMLIYPTAVFEQVRQSST